MRKSFWITKMLLTLSFVFISLITWGFGENVNLFIAPSVEADVVKYRVHRSDTSGGPYTSVGEVAQSGSPMFTDAAVDLSSTKFYVMTAVDNGGLESPFSNEIQADGIPAGTPPAAPTVTVVITVSQ